MLVLKLLEEEEKYGYQLICELRQESHECFKLKEGTLYPILYRLEDDGDVQSRWSEPKGKEVSRKYYAITKDGKQNLKEMQLLWQTFSVEVNKIMED